MERRRLAKKFFLLAGVVSVLVLCVYLAWFYHAQSIENDRRALAEAVCCPQRLGLPGITSMPSSRRSTARRAKPREFIARWRPKTSPSASPPDLPIRFATFVEIPVTPRMPPMTSSARRISSFEEGVVEEYYGLEHQGDSSVFRYVGLLEIEDGCLAVPR